MLSVAHYFAGVQARDSVIVSGAGLVSNMPGASCGPFVISQPLALSASGGCVEMGKREKWILEFSSRFKLGRNLSML